MYFHISYKYLSRKGWGNLKDVMLYQRLFFRYIYIYCMMSKVLRKLTVVVRFHRLSLTEFVLMDEISLNSTMAVNPIVDISNILFVFICSQEYLMPTYSTVAVTPIRQHHWYIIIITIIIIINRFYITLFSAREQTLRSCAYDSQLMTIAFYSAFWISTKEVYL